jgi:peptidoglycan/xylan/chitin deacetylase (PgdA/CDA1 family)
MTSLAARFFFFLADIIGLNRWFRGRNKRGIRILMYHGVTADPPPFFYWTQLPLDKFRKQLDHIIKYYHVKDPGLLYNKDFNDINSVVITFDDGLRNVYTEARPELIKKNFEALLFVLPELSADDDIIWPDKIYEILYNCGEKTIDLGDYNLGVIDLATDFESTVKNLIAELKSRSHDNRLAVVEYLQNTFGDRISKKIEPFRLMKTEMIIKLARGDLFEIGLHTNRHPILSTMPADQQEREISEPLAELKKWGIEPLMVFAYPNGRSCDYNETTVDILKKHGFKAALTTVDGFYKPGRDEPYHIKRIPIGADMSMAEFKARLSGLYYFVRKLLGKR